MPAFTVMGVRPVANRYWLFGLPLDALSYYSYGQIRPKFHRVAS